MRLHLATLPNEKRAIKGYEGTTRGAETLHMRAVIETATFDLSKLCCLLLLYFNT